MIYYLQLNLNQLIMKKAGLLLGLLLLLGLNYQCTEDEDIQANVDIRCPFGHFIQVPGTKSGAVFYHLLSEVFANGSQCYQLFTRGLGVLFNGNQAQGRFGQGPYRLGNCATANVVPARHDALYVLAPHGQAVLTFRAYQPENDGLVPVQHFATAKRVLYLHAHCVMHWKKKIQQLSCRAMPGYVSDAHICGGRCCGRCGSHILSIGGSKSRAILSPIFYTFYIDNNISF